MQRYLMFLKSLSVLFLLLWNVHWGKKKHENLHFELFLDITNKKTTKFWKPETFFRYHDFFLSNVSSFTKNLLLMFVEVWKSKIHLHRDFWIKNGIRFSKLLFGIKNTPLFHSQLFSRWFECVSPFLGVGT